MWIPGSRIPIRMPRACTVTLRCSSLCFRPTLRNQALSLSNHVRHQSSTTLPRYQYTPLAPGQIRVLHLDLKLGDNNDAPLQGHISHANPDSDHYLAFSYVWGGPEREYRMTINENADESRCSEISLTKSLYELLKDMRFRFSEANGDENVSAAFFVDQICINQDDHVEKADQVALMGYLYRKAAAVITYIGPERQNSKAGLQVLCEMFSRAEEMPDLHVFLAKSSGEKLTQFFRLDSLTDDDWAGLRDVVDRDWLDRAWIVQENVLNSQCLFACGDCFLPLEYLTFFADLFAHLVSMHEKMGAEDAELALSQSRSQQSISTESDLSSPKPDSSRAQIVDRVIKLLQIAGLQEAVSNNNTPRLSFLMSRFRRLSCKDPRDKVYAMLGLASDAGGLGIRADYDRTSLETYREMTKRTILLHGDLDVLSQAGTGSSTAQSWVPDWSIPDGYHNCNWHAPAGSSLMRCSFKESDKVLVLDGIFIDEIAMSVGFWRTNKIEADGNLSVIAYARGLVGLDLQDFSAEDAIRIATFLKEAPAYAVARFDSNVGKRFSADSVSLLMDSIKDSSFVEGEEGRSSWDKSLEVHESVRWLLEEARSTSGKEICGTRAKRLCSSRVEAQPGDRVAVLFGGRMCYILRPMEESGNYRFISDAYIEDFMDGQVMTDPVLARSVETIRIV